MFFCLYGTEKVSSYLGQTPSRISIFLVLLGHLLNPDDGTVFECCFLAFLLRCYPAERFRWAVPLMSDLSQCGFVIGCACLAFKTLGALQQIIH